MRWRTFFVLALRVCDGLRGGPGRAGPGWRADDTTWRTPRAG